MTIAPKDRTADEQAAADRRWLRAALSLSHRGLGRVAPNPTVAALVVRDGRLLGRGVTSPGGRPHAEAIALDRVHAAHGPAGARGATVYVTLEPCAHHGLTPPCADALVAAGVARVVCPIEDPDPRVSGRGFARLREAGVVVETGLLAAEARAANAGFLARIERGRPHVTLKLAASLDGRIATASGESRWITGPQARARVHAMRAESDAIMVGAGTARQDDPMLDVRGHGPNAPRPVRVVVDPGLTLPVDGRLARTAGEQPVWVVCSESAEPARVEALRALGADTVATALDPAGRIAPLGMLRRLAERGITRLFCEGGGRVAASLLRDGLVDDLVVFTAGLALGADGIPAVGLLQLEALADAPRMDLVDVELVGADTLATFRRPG